MIAELEPLKHLFLHDWDPIGVAEFAGAEDEYDAYAFQVFTELHHGASIEALAAYLHWLETEHGLCPSPAGANSRSRGEPSRSTLPIAPDRNGLVLR